MTCGTESLLCAVILDVPEPMDSVQPMTWIGISRANIHLLLHIRSPQRGIVAMFMDASLRTSLGQDWTISGVILNVSIHSL